MGLLSDPDSTSRLEEAIKAFKPKTGGSFGFCNIDFDRIKPRLTDVNKVMSMKDGRSPYRVSDEGSIMTRPDRLLVDGKIFRAPAKNAKGWCGGSILLDVSGSMRLDWDGVWGLVKKAPYKTTLAVYSGNAHTPNDSRFAVLSHRGKVVSKSWLEDVANNIKGTYNACDGPALKWLCRQPGPRLWVGDGFINGIGGYGTSMLGSYCASIQRDGDIMRIQNIGCALYYFKTGDKRVLLDWKKFPRVTWGRR